MYNENNNALEAKLKQLFTDKLDIAEFMQFLLTAQVFLPVEDDNSTISGFQSKPQAKPLIIELSDNDSVLKAMIVFSSPEKSKQFLSDYPDYSGGLLVDIGWILARISPETSLSINPNMEMGIDLDPSTIQQLVTLKQRMQHE